MDVIYCINSSDSNTLWYLIHCQSRKEYYTANILERSLGISVYVPEYAMASRERMRRIPFFPGYIFVQANLQKVPLSQVNTSPGVLRLVEFDGDPLPIPRDVIEEIEERLKHANVPNLQPFHAGDTVRMKHDGPLQSLDMVFLGPTTSSRRVRVLLSLLGRLKEVDVDADALEKVSTDEKKTLIGYQRRERYTRGKGRKIYRPGVKSG